MLIFVLVLNMTVSLTGPLSSDLTNVTVSALKCILYGPKLKKKTKLILNIIQYDFKFNIIPLDGLKLVVFHFKHSISVVIIIKHLGTHMCKQLIKHDTMLCCCTIQTGKKYKVKYSFILYIDIDISKNYKMKISIFYSK